MNKYVFSVTENTIKYSDVKMVFSPGILSVASNALKSELLQGLLEVQFA